MSTANSTSSEISSRSTRDPRTGPTPGRELAQLAAEAALDKKARDVVVMDLRGISGEVDYFVICTGDSDLQIKAIVESVVDTLREKADELPVHREGQPGRSRWIVLDYFDLAVHVFGRDTREHYDLERLWGDAPMETVTEDDPVVALLKNGASLRAHEAGSERGADEEATA